MLNRSGQLSVPVFVRMAVMAIIAAVCLAPRAEAQTTARFNIPAQSLAESLRAVGSQTNINILFDPPMVVGRNAPALQAQLTAGEALARILAGSGITHQFLNESTVVLALPESGEQGQSSVDVDVVGASRHGSTGAVATAGMSAVRLVQVEREVADSEAMQGSNAGAPDRQDAATSSSTELVVTGSHLRGVKELAVPSISITREQIERTGHATTQDVFESLPQNFAEVSSDGLLGHGGSDVAGLNRDRAAGVDLRGLGAGSTLTLLNGSRRAGSINGQIVDVSIIPLSVIERIDVVTGGRSAAYGSDAVAGVVNLVTRRDFSGIESQAYYGASERGGEHLQFSAITGADFGRGGFVAAYDYSRNRVLDLLDTPLAAVPRPDGVVPLLVDLRPESSRHSAFLSGRYSLGDRVELFGDLLYSTRELEAGTRDLWPGAVDESFSLTRNDSDQYSLSAGASVGLASDWALNLKADYSVADTEGASESVFDLGLFVFVSDDVFNTRTTNNAFSVVADGPLFAIAGDTAQLAVGAEIRREDMDRFNSIGGVPIDRFIVDREREITSAFAELSVPLFVDNAQRVELSLAGRYDDYSDFGDTFNPQVGLIWSTGENLTLRGAYSTAFRAPALTELGSLSRVLITSVQDPMTGGQSPLLQWQGPNEGLVPEEASTWSVGFDYEPVFAPGARVSFSYFEVEYEDRIAVPAFADVDQALVLQRQERYLDLVTRNPGAALVQIILDSDADGAIANFTGTAYNPATDNILDVFPGLVVFDNRSGNIAIENVRGMDLGFTTRHQMPSGRLDLGFNATYTLEHDRSVTSASPAFALLNEPGKPVDFRLRGNAGWTGAHTGIYLYVNYVDGYRDPTLGSGGAGAAVSSWTTVNLTTRFDSAGLGRLGPLGDFSVALSVDNLFDRDPPRVSSSDYGLLFDSANASALGRYMSLRLSKRW